MSNPIKRGYLYVLSNPYFNSKPEEGKESSPIYKIGISIHIRVRVLQLSRDTGVPGPFEIVRLIEINDYDRSEQLLHICLDHYRIKHNNPQSRSYKEFFEIDILELNRIIDILCKFPSLQAIDKTNDCKDTEKFKNLVIKNEGKREDEGEGEGEDENENENENENVNVNIDAVGENDNNEDDNNDNDDDDDEYDEGNDEDDEDNSISVSEIFTMEKRYNNKPIHVNYQVLNGRKSFVNCNPDETINKKGDKVKLQYDFGIRDGFRATVI
jgi:hypothetical protein